jgi:hypothetical protein
MMSHVTLEHVLQSHRERQRAVKAEEQAEEARNWQYWKEMEKGISPRLYDDKLHDILSDSCHESGLWLEKKTQFRTWKDGAAKSRCLWLSGIPGAGRASLVIFVLPLLSVSNIIQAKRTYPRIPSADCRAKDIMCSFSSSPTTT